MAAVDHVTRAEVKAQIEVTTTTTDALIDAAITAASQAINTRYARELTPRTNGETRIFRADANLVDLEPFDLRNVNTVALHPESPSPQTLAANVGYALEPVNGSLGGSFLRLRLGRDVSPVSTFSEQFGYARLSILGDWGLFDTAQVPADVKRGTIITVGAWLDRAVAEYGVYGTDSMRELRPDGMASWAIPFAAHTIFMPWARVTV